jgi:hypothetical protein
MFRNLFKPFPNRAGKRVRPRPPGLHVEPLHEVVSFRL